MILLDLEHLRRETPGCGNGIALNNASASLMPEPVGAAMGRYLDEELRFGPHAAAERNDERLQKVAASTTALTGAAGGVEFFDTVARGWSLLAGAMDWRPGERILLSRSEWGSLIAAAGGLARTAGLTVEWLPVTESGQLDHDALAERMDDRVRLISLPLLTAIGGRPTVRASFPRPERCLVFADGAQALGQMPFDMEDSGFDVVIGTARKWLRGPRGIAFAALSRAGRELANRARWLGGTPDRNTVVSDHSRMLHLGLGAAVDYALAIGLERIRERVDRLAQDLQQRLQAIPGVVPVYAAPRSGIVAFSATGREESLVNALATRGIRVALVHARYHPVLFEDLGRDRVVRVSVHYYNTEQDLAACADAVAAILDH